jgi:hypothetical protein
MYYMYHFNMEKFYIFPRYICIFCTIPRKTAIISLKIIIQFDFVMGMQWFLWGRNWIFNII